MTPAVKVHSGTEIYGRTVVKVCHRDAGGMGLLCRREVKPVKHMRKQVPERNCKNTHS